MGGFLYGWLGQANEIIIDEYLATQDPHFELQGDFLMRVTRDKTTGSWQSQLLIPRPYRRQILKLTYDVPLCGRTFGDREEVGESWEGFSGVYQEIKEYCVSCQLVAPQFTSKAPLLPVPVEGIPFEQVKINFLESLKPRSWGSKFILVLIAYATSYPKAVVVCLASAQILASQILQIFSWVSIPREVLTDQGTAFMPWLLQEVWALLKIHSVRTSVYQPQTNGLVKRYNQTLKGLL